MEEDFNTDYNSEHFTGEQEFLANMVLIQPVVQQEEMNLAVTENIERFRNM